MKIDTNSIAHTTWNCKYHIMIFDKHANMNTDTETENFGVEDIMLTR